MAEPACGDEAEPKIELGGASERERTGRGRLVEVAMQEAAYASLTSGVAPTASESTDCHPPNCSGPLADHSKDFCDKCEAPHTPRPLRSVIWSLPGVA